MVSSIVIAQARPCISALLIDISGTLMIGSTPTPGAVQALARLREARVSFRFCSNTSKESTDFLRKRMLEAGFDVPSSCKHKQEVWTSIGAVKGFMESKNLRRPYFLLSESAQQECTISPSYVADAPYDSVIVGLAPALFSYDYLNAAFRILMGEHESQKRIQSKREIPLIALHKARYLESSDNALSLGPGPFVAALENASGLRAEVIGKPSRNFFETVIGDFNSDELGPNDCVAVIGDDVQADLGDGAIDLNLWRILVKTGKYRAGDESRSGVHPPDEVCDSFASFVELFLAG
ncbi:hypothetical protein BV22DRAFT_1106226 [Leucogyrophana mollusca]|uniref:Uncharacterized protein n=1 Tax=Leucogyrophana mollusca TaxID=85980 RepID=A0ACB8BEC1_9AGAM|nr:hypothetical protein BV22DRAFT_1106226 [Leucogyrophana mollusca]